MVRRSRRHVQAAADIFGGSACGRGGALAVGLYITAAYWFTSSTSFANPAVTLARGFTDDVCRHRARRRTRLHPGAVRRRRDRVAVAMTLFPAAQGAAAGVMPSGRSEEFRPGE